MTATRKWQPYRLSGWLGIGICVAVAALAFLGLRASREFRQSSLQLAQRRVDEGARFLSIALVRDMRAVQNSVLSSPEWNEFGVDTHQLMPFVASAFARYPYPEAFFVWRAGRPPEEMRFFARADRPRMSQMEPEPIPYPVRLETDRGLAEQLIQRLEGRTGADGFLVSGFDVGGVPYQAIARLAYRDHLRQQLDVVNGFIVNLAWVREHYVSELTNQLIRIEQVGAGVTFAILDEKGVPVVGTPVTDGLIVSRRTFPFAFFDPLQSRPSGVAWQNWTIVASTSVNPVSAFSSLGLDFALGIAALAALAFTVSLAVTARAMRASAQLAGMRADFMSSVTHELKTPIASIRAMADTLARGRLRDPDAQQEYVAVVGQEAVRLSRLVDNVLAYARITDVADIYSFERVDVEELIGTILGRFKHQLRTFAVTVDVPSDLSHIWADRLAMELLLDNLVDNAVRYSNATNELHIAATPDGEFVKITVADRGIGVAPDDLGQITKKFVRGRNNRTQGSGLGLAIVDRITKDHDGTLSIRARPDGGTSVEVKLRKAPDEGYDDPAWTNHDQPRIGSGKSA